MRPQPSQPQTAELFRPRLDEQLNMRHPLIRLAALRPALPPRLVAGLLHLQRANDASDEAVVNIWLENPY